MDHGARERYVKRVTAKCIVCFAEPVASCGPCSVEKLYTLRKTQPDEITKNTLNCSPKRFEMLLLKSLTIDEKERKR